MPIIQLDPSSSAPISFPGLSVVGAPTAHEALSDASDSTYLRVPVTEFETSKWFHGELPPLPDGAGVVVGVVVNVRASKEDPPGFEAANLHVGDLPNVRVANPLPDGAGITDFASPSITDLDVAEVNAAQWMAGADWMGEEGGQVADVRIYRLNFVVDFNFVSGVSAAFVFEVLGPLVAVGLWEMPRLARELFRRSGVLLRPRDLAPVWTELCAWRGRRSFA